MNWTEYNGKDLTVYRWEDRRQYLGHRSDPGYIKSRRLSGLRGDPVMLSHVILYGMATDRITQDNITEKN